MIISISTAVEDSDDKAVVKAAQRTKSCLQVVERDIFGRVRHHNLAHVVLHHSMAAVVHYCQRLLAGICVSIDLFLVRVQDFFDRGHTEIGLLKNIVVLIEAVLLNILAEDFYVL